jgi:hypothetical protein
MKNENKTVDLTPNHLIRTLLDITKGIPVNANNREWFEQIYGIVFQKHYNSFAITRVLNELSMGVHLKPKDMKYFDMICMTVYEHYNHVR